MIDFFINILYTPVEAITNVVELCKNMTKNCYVVNRKPLLVYRKVSAKW